MKKIILLLFSIAILAPDMAYGAGIAVSPAKIELEAVANGKALAKLTVTNPTADVQLFEVYPDDFSNMFKANPASFTLEAGGKKLVAITFEDSNKNPKKLQTNISVVAKPLVESRFQANSGVKIPITVTLNPSSKREFPVWVPLLFASMVLIALLVYSKFRCNSQSLR